MVESTEPRNAFPPKRDATPCVRPPAGVHHCQQPIAGHAQPY